MTEDSGLRYNRVNWERLLGYSDDTSFGVKVEISKLRLNDSQSVHRPRHGRDPGSSLV